MRRSAAVSRIELITREKGAAEGVRVSVQAGDIVDMSPIGCPEGTSITVRDIFHNTPARLKFLKSDRSEASACISAALHCALGRPEVSVRLKRDGEEVFFTPGDGREESAVYALLGRETARGMLPVSGKGESMAVTASPRPRLRPRQPRKPAFLLQRQVYKIRASAIGSRAGV